MTIWTSRVILSNGMPRVQMALAFGIPQLAVNLRWNTTRAASGNNKYLAICILCLMWLWYHYFAIQCGIILFARTLYYNREPFRVNIDCSRFIREFEVRAFSSYVVFLVLVVSCALKQKGFFRLNNNHLFVLHEYPNSVTSVSFKNISQSPLKTIERRRLLFLRHSLLPCIFLVLSHVCCEVYVLANLYTA